VLTSEYYNTNDPAERAAISAKADAIRAEPKYQANSKDPYTIPAADARQADAIVQSVQKQWKSNGGGALTASQWGSALSAAPYGGVGVSSSQVAKTGERSTSLAFAGTIVTSTFTPKLYPIENKISITTKANTKFWSNAEIFNSNERGYQWFRDDDRLFMAASQMAWELEQSPTDISEIKEYNKIVLVQHLADAKRTGAIDSQTYDSVATTLVKYGHSFDGHIDLARFKSLMMNDSTKVDWVKAADKYVDQFGVAEYMECIVLYSFIYASVQMRGTGYTIEGSESITDGTGNGYPTNRAELHEDLTSKGYTVGDPSPGGYVVYKGPDGRSVTIKPSGEVIPHQQVKIDPNDSTWNAPKYTQRQFYDGTPIPGNSHTTGHFVEPFGG